MPIKLDFKKLIFVMEDVDAATSVVHKRSADEKQGGGTGGDNDSDGSWDDVGNNDGIAMLLAMLASTQDVKGPVGVAGGDSKGGIGGGIRRWSWRTKPTSSTSRGCSTCL